jgi:hypothetical protein
MQVCGETGEGEICKLQLTHFLVIFYHRNLGFQLIYYFYLNFGKKKKMIKKLGVTFGR